MIDSFPSNSCCKSSYSVSTATCYRRLIRKYNCLYGEISETLKNLEFYSAFKFQDDAVDAHIGFINNRERNELTSAGYRF
jgi:hypothetical protein